MSQNRLSPDPDMIFFKAVAIIAVAILIVLMWKAPTSPKQLTLAEADAVLHNFERNPDLAEIEIEQHSPENCSDKYTFYFSEVADSMASLEKPASIEDAKKQVRLIDYFLYDMRTQSGNICKLGHQLAKSAIAKVAHNVNDLYEGNNMPTEDELYLLSQIAGSGDIQLSDAVKKRLANKDCLPMEDPDYPYPAYICA